MAFRRFSSIPVMLVLVGGHAYAEERLRVERFDRDPNWDGVNNRSTAQEPREVRQDFGFSSTKFAGGERGEIGGRITPAAETAYYAQKISRRSFADTLTASGRLLVKPGAPHVLIGFFNSTTVNEWRTPNSIAIRVQGRGEHFYAYVEYATARWRAGADTPGGFATVRDPQTGRSEPRGFRCGVVHDWSLRYDPAGNGGQGTITVTLGGETSVCHLDVGHREDGATVDRFGLLTVMKSVDSSGEVYLDDVTINGERQSFDRDPAWEGVGNRRTFVSADVRPRFDFGHTPTRFAGGTPGELGGLVFRGDCREANRLAAYGDRIGPLSLNGPLRASGRVALRRGVSDSTTLLGFYHSKDSLTVNPSQSSGWPRSFLGIVVEGPSREGFLFYPAYRTRGDAQGFASGETLPHILPDGQAHEWALVYDPRGAEGRGSIVVTFDGQKTTLAMPAGHRDTKSRFDRFGIVSTWIDGNGQRIYFDDLTYTIQQ